LGNLSYRIKLHICGQAYNCRSYSERIAIPETIISVIELLLREKDYMKLNRIDIDR